MVHINEEFMLESLIEDTSSTDIGVNISVSPVKVALCPGWAASIALSKASKFSRFQ